ncbi:ARABIDOPSIS THALIANA TRNA ADENOSINE DEAMINASE A, tRNA arginine adenosine deaminase [Hibiscus trionum]|uniref:tRNA(adenine(34)) deaminase n=1 Tax=Hibiscus trionum TaxID=183268 RepID=A0A9W7MIH8_HIBTR|nr:ARABIDOPSIS THALIANA TRNA ADENOSINE DEAMINASE A, tRNA arginine adenosine deaminase [Hibiscus trionum]
MYNSCSISSSVLSVRSNGSLSFSFNDCSSSVFNSSLDKTPFLSSSPSPCHSSCCSSCACCCSTFTATATHRLPITPCFLYGLRQSALVHCSPSRRFISPAGYRCLLRFPSCDLDRAAFEVSTGSRLSRKAKGRFRCVVWEDNTASSRYLLGGVDAAEAMISLLSEAVDGECLGTGEINRRSYKRVEVDKAKDYNSKCSSMKKNSKKVVNKTSHDNECKNEAKRKLQSDERGGHANECYRRETRTVGSGLLESDSKDEYDYVAVESREESRRKAKNESTLRAEHLRGRTGSSSCSSYYSLSSSGDLESDTELSEQEQFVEESIRDEISRSEGQVAEGRKRDNAGWNSVDWDLRKKSEKKLAEVSAEEIQSGAKSSQEYARRVKNDASDYAKRSSSHEQLDVKDWEIRKQHTRTNNQIIGQSESRRKSQEVREMSKIHVSDVGTNSQEKQFTGREANVRVSEIRDSTERISTLQKKSESRMKIEEEDRNLVQSRSGSKMKIWEEDTAMDQSSFQQIRKQQQQRDERITGQLEMRRKSECSSEINEAKNKKTSILQSRTQKMKSDDTSSLNFTSDQKLPQRIEPGNGMQAITNISVVHADNTKIVTNTQISSGERLVEHESNFTPGLGRNNERSEIQNEANGRVQQKKSRKENLKPASVSSSWGKAEEGSSFQASLSLVSETREQQSHADLEESENRSKEDVLIPPQPQAIAGGLLHDASMTRIFTGEASGKTESGSTTSYMHSRGRTTFAHHEPYARKRSETHGESINLTTHEDSAQRLEESSSQFVGELVEKARHDILTSGAQQGNISSDFTSAYEGDKHGPSSSGQYGKEDLKMKRNDSRQSSKGSGGKGPSDEMWDVTDPSVQEPLEAEVPQQTSTSEHAIIKRSGRSLWTLMGDVVRLPWSSRAQVPSSSSAARSGGRTSPDESVRSETWFSGHETNGNSEENQERSNLASEVISHQLGQGTQGEGDFSDSIRTTEKLGHVEGNISPSSNIYETAPAPAPEVISLTSQKEKHEGSSFEVASSGKEVVQSSLPLPAGSTRTSLVVEEISEPDKINIQGSGSMRTMEQPLGVRVAEASGSEGKEGELKQRKLQRTKQVPRDRFDEWEEAYRLEREQRKIDEMFMREALLEAKKAADSWEVPVGAVLVQHGKIIARGRNLVEEFRDSTAHAEMICIREASSILRSWRLADTTLYVTLEPCPMCAGAILQARIDTVVWGAPNKLLGADGSWIRLFPDGRGGNGSEVTDKPAAPVHPFHPNMRIRRGILTSECADMMQQFFQLRRKNKGKNAEQPQSPSCLPITTSHRSKFFTKMHDVLHLMFCL